MELKLLRVDGSKIDANASLYKSVRYDRAKAPEKQLRKEVRERMKEAERADASNRPDPDALSRAAIRSLAEQQGFVFIETYGKWRNFTINFRKPLVADRRDQSDLLTRRTPTAK